MALSAHIARMATGAQFPAEHSDEGEFERQDDAFRDWVKADGSTPYAPASGRYHLYVSLACPWAHRTVIVRQLKQLLSERGGMLAAFLLLMPIGTGAASGVLTQAAVAARWGADANAVALTQGGLSGVVTAVCRTGAASRADRFDLTMAVRTLPLACSRRVDPKA